MNQEEEMVIEVEVRNPEKKKKKFFIMELFQDYYDVNLNG